MARKNKGVHSSPETAGAQNLTDANLSKLKVLRKDDDGVGRKINDIAKLGELNFQKYKGKWTEEELKQSIADFFDHCAEVEIRPSQPLLLLWLNLSKQQLSAWKRDGNKFQYKTDLIKKALLMIEAQLQADIYKYPTGAIFLLKTSHEHIETSKLDVTTNGKDVSDATEVKDLVAKMGLDKSK